MPTSTRWGEERNRSTRVWDPMRTGSPAPTSRTWSRLERGRSADGSALQVCRPPVHEATDPGAGYTQVPWANQDNRHFQIGDGLHLKLRKQNCATAGQSVVQVARSTSRDACSVANSIVNL